DVNAIIYFTDVPHRRSESRLPTNAAFELGLLFEERLRRSVHSGEVLHAQQFRMTQNKVGEHRPREGVGIIEGVMQLLDVRTEDRRVLFRNRLGRHALKKREFVLKGEFRRHHLLGRNGGWAFAVKRQSERELTGIRWRHLEVEEVAPVRRQILNDE